MEGTDRWSARAPDLAAPLLGPRLVSSSSIGTHTHRSSRITRHAHNGITPCHSPQHSFSYTVPIPLAVSLGHSATGDTLPESIARSGSCAAATLARRVPPVATSGMAMPTMMIAVPTAESAVCRTRRGQRVQRHAAQKARCGGTERGMRSEDDSEESERLEDCAPRARVLACKQPRTATARSCSHRAIVQLPRVQPPCIRLPRVQPHPHTAAPQLLRGRRAPATWPSTRAPHRIEGPCRRSPR